jgi:hypothetical protein
LKTLLSAGGIMSTDTLKKMALLPQILEAAQLLHKLGLTSKRPATYVKQYVEENPDINQLLQQTHGKGR